MDTKLLDIQNMLRLNGFMICFSGRLSQGLIEEYGEAVKKYLEIEDRPINQITKVFALFIEQTQNINRYTAAKSGSSNYDRIVFSSIVTIGKGDNGYYVYSGNLIEDQDADELKNYIDHLLTLDKDALKRLYKEKLSQQIQADSGGAGVGLIEMARKASFPLEYSITSVQDKLSFFTLKAVI